MAMTLEQLEAKVIAWLGDVAANGSLSGAAVQDISEAFSHISQPAQAVDVDTAMEGWHSAHCDISDIEHNAPDERFRRRAANVRAWMERNQPCAIGTAQGWRPIASAPKDGTYILATDGRDCGCSVVQWDEGGWVYAWHEYDGPIFMSDATHWQPLPVPPTDGEG